MQGISKYLKRAVIDVEYFVNSALVFDGSNSEKKSDNNIDSKVVANNTETNSNHE